MKRIFFHIAVSLFTFTVALCVTGMFRLYFKPDVTLPEVVKIQREFSCFPGRSARVLKSTSQTEYFPVAELSDDFWGRRFRNGWYSRQLEAMNELPLAALTQEDESYRFLWLRAFHQPVMVHVWRSGIRHFIVVKRLNGRSGYNVGTFDLYWSRSLSEDDWDSFLMRLEQSAFWLMPTNDDDVLAHDGAQWIMEGYREDRYHIVDRQSPAASAYADACLYLLKQSGLLAEIPSDEIY